MEVRTHKHTQTHRETKDERGQTRGEIAHAHGVRRERVQLRLEGVARQRNEHHSAHVSSSQQRARPRGACTQHARETESIRFFLAEPCTGCGRRLLKGSTHFSHFWWKLLIYIHKTQGNDAAKTRLFDDLNMAWLACAGSTTHQSHTLLLRHTCSCARSRVPFVFFYSSNSVFVKFLETEIGRRRCSQLSTSMPRRSQR
jgi:hypothetical protein